MIDPMKLLRRSRLPIWLVAVLPLVAATCGTATSSSTPRTSPASSLTSSVTPPSPTPTPSPSSSSPPLFHSTTSVIAAATRARMASSWHRGCPVPVQDLRYLTMSYWGFDGAVHAGEMVVNRSVAGAVAKVFGELFAARFPMRRMRLVDAYGGDDDRSMAANNTSAFNCRAVTGGTSWSQHSYGWAIDINPIQNPYVSRAGAVLPPAGPPDRQRSPNPHGMIPAGGPRPRG